MEFNKEMMELRFNSCPREGAMVVRGVSRKAA